MNTKDLIKLSDAALLQKELSKRASLWQNLVYNMSFDRTAAAANTFKR